MFSYKKNMEETVLRHEKMWTGKMRDGILLKVDVEGLDTMDFAMEQISNAPDIPKLFNAYKEYYAKRQDLLDDSIPVARGSFGSGAITHFFGGEVHWTPGGAYSTPIVDDPDSFDFSRLQYNPDNEWVQKQLNIIKYFVEQAEGLFPVCITEVILGLNFAEFVRGTNIYYDLYDRPEFVHGLLRESVKFNKRLVEEQRKLIPKYKGGVFDMFEVWLPGNQIWNSVDAYGNCSAEHYRTFGKNYYEEFGGIFGGNWMHMHSSALRLVKEVANTRYISCISISDDINAPRGFDQIEEIAKNAGSIPLNIFCTKDELVDGIEKKTLKKNVYYWVTKGVATIKEANELVEFAKAY